MANTTTIDANQLIKFNKKLVYEFLRHDQFQKLKNSYGTSIFHVENSNGGDTNIP